MYIGKLDGGISQGYFDQMSGTFRKEQRDTLQKIEQHQAAHETYLEEGVRLCVFELDVEGWKADSAVSKTF